MANAKRLQIAARVLAGVVGGYMLSALVAVSIAKNLPGQRLEAVLTGWMVAVLLQCLAIIWAFAASTTLRACLWIGFFVAAFGAINMAGLSVGRG